MKRNTSTHPWVLWKQWAQGRGWPGWGEWREGYYRTRGEAKQAQRDMERARPGEFSYRVTREGQ